MTRLNQEVDRLAVELAWSLWAELGVDGVLRRHDWQAIDLEPLIIFTAHLGDADNRLRASTIDWCIANARFVSAFRLRNLADQASPQTRTAFGRYAATVRAHSKAPWPGEGDPLTLFHPEHIGSPDLRRPSLIQLRLRALVGVSARAEVLKLMLAEPDRPQAASTLAEDAAYGKGSVAQALDMLTRAGIVQVQPDANRMLYRLARPGELAQALLWLPSVFPDWWPIFKVVEALADYVHSAAGPASARAAAVHSLLDRIDPDLHRLGNADQVPRATGSASIAEFEHWALAFLAEQTGHAQPATAAREVSYVIHHLSFGGWLGTINVAGREPRPFGPEQGQLDETPAVAQLVHLIFMDVLGKGQRRGAPAAPDDALIQVISREFAEELVRPMRVGQEATFTAEFLRRWYENRRQRFGATA
ncbi:MAG TPA: winged helix-turn-helix domain-containing protein [Candidatus Dormibacteraeota bacterium]|nr:winged helix-turn-helix domain-containing protein [Candidatus Dormibacteraeota bacterium]